MKWPAHGSNPQYLFKALNQQMPDQKFDFSANINPLGPPPILKENWQSLFSTISDYPDPKGMRLKKKLAEHNGVDENQILIGNGGAEIISLIGRMIAGKQAVIVQPAFSEYEEACRINGCTIEYHQLKADHWEWVSTDLSTKLTQADALFLCNPNNPTGVYYPESVVLELLQQCKQNDCLLIVDEAFYDFVIPYEPIAGYLKEFSNLLIIRSMTKMFAIPGLRLGYLISAVETIKRLEIYQPQWSMNALALQAGEWCLESESYLQETLELIHKEKTRLFAFYNDQSFKVSPSDTNFYLVKDPALDDQLPFFQFLIERGIIPRHTMNFPGIQGEWLRFAVKMPADNDRLMEAVAKWQRNRPSYL